MSHRPDAEEAAHLQYETEHASPSRGKSVIPYMVILIAAAFVLLFVAYAMQRRTAESVQGLNQSANSFRTIDQLVEDNRTLHEQVAQLQEELKESEEHSRELEGQLEGALTGAEAADFKNRHDVLVAFTMLEQALRDKDYTLAAGYVKQLCSGEYDLNLGMASENAYFSPSQRLEEIIPLLVRQGALAKDEVTVPPS